MTKEILSKTILGGALLLVLATGFPASAQDAASPKFVFFSGTGPLLSQGHSKGSFQAGVALEESPPGSWGGFSFELGYLGPWSKSSDGSAFFSADYMASWCFGQKAAGRMPDGTIFWTDRGWKFLPFATAGYSRLFGSGNALNFGGGLDYRLNEHYAFRIEMRDYYLFASPRQHNIAFRVGWNKYLED
jgi:hypothetical protein